MFCNELVSNLRVWSITTGASQLEHHNWCFTGTSECAANVLVSVQWAYSGCWLLWLCFHTALVFCFASTSVFTSILYWAFRSVPELLSIIMLWTFSVASTSVLMFILYWRALLLPELLCSCSYCSGRLFCASGEVARALVSVCN